MRERRRRHLLTVKKDEAGFYLNELARGLLSDRIHFRVGSEPLVMSTFHAIRLEIDAHEQRDRYTLAITLSWPKAATPEAAA